MSGHRSSDGFPAPLWLALTVAAACGGIGAFAADLVTDGGRIEQWRRDEAGWSLGFVAKMFIGLVAAVIFLTLNPPGEAWVALVGTALAAGVGGEAILLAIVAARRAQAAEIGHAQARKEIGDTLDAWAENIRTFESVALATTPATATATGERVDPAVVSTFADRAVAEIRLRGKMPYVS